jgi:hypothetical protein
MAILLLISCMGFDLSTNVDELRVMAIKSEPLEVRLSDYTAPMIELPINEEDEEESPPTLQIALANPKASSVNIAVWQCTNLGDGCLEAEIYSEDPASWIQLVQTTETSISLPLPLNPVWTSLFTQEPQVMPFTGIWAVACNVDTCELLEQARQGNWDLETFADPFSMSKDLPITDTSIATKQLIVSNFDSSIPRIENPILIPTFDENELSTAAESLELPFDIELSQIDTDRASIYGYATLGGFDANSFANNAIEETNQSKTLTWYAPTDKSDTAGELYVIVNDGLGGVNYWLGSITTTEE